ncbi:hypothetical protein [Halorubrum cibi]|uniref:Uncharacterized protein n=1 Tax=Halorubrum cibi TaxID=413815 RepID=A0A521EBT5_9EURY|nr:hypothetical protein [Halorubrum cibi]SMO81383.1 hypothetical protein SAMN06264867_11013 [Halorubrum cibi]
MASDEDSGRIPRRGLLAALGGVVGCGAYIFTERRSASGAGGWCPSEAEMETMSWIRGHFERVRQPVTAGEPFDSTLMLKNSGGKMGTYEANLRLAKLEEGQVMEKRFVTSVSVDVPARSATEATITTEAPRTGGRWRLEAPQLASSCDLIRATVQDLEVVEI